MRTGEVTQTPWRDFDAAAAAAVSILHSWVGLDLWLVTRVQGDQQIVVAAAPAGLVNVGMSLSWAQGFCVRMATGAGPRVAPVTAAVPAYAGLDGGPAARVAAYLGVPLNRDDGTLFGTLCGFALRAQPASLVRQLPMVELVAGLLATVLAQQHAADTAATAAQIDPLTGLRNRRGWEHGVDTEEARCARHHLSASVLVLDVDGLKTVNDSQGHAAGDDCLRRVAEVLQRGARPADVLARTGGDEFAVLAVETGIRAAGALAGRLRQQLADAGLTVSVGAAGRRGRGGLSDAWQRADMAMYAARRSAAGRTRAAPTTP